MPIGRMSSQAAGFGPWHQSSMASPMDWTAQALPEGSGVAVLLENAGSNRPKAFSGNRSLASRVL